MSRPRRARAVIEGRAGTEAWLWARLHDTAPPQGISTFDRWMYLHADSKVLKAAWKIHNEEILSRWASVWPGTRPSCWWAFDAPRQPLGTWPDCFYDGQLPQPRRRTGGQGTPEHEALAIVPVYELGLPARWLKSWWIAQRRAIGDHFNRADPPRFESQAAYLRRHRLLDKSEAQLLPADAFADALLPRKFWPTEEAA
jgi:hypothetical protein